MKRNKKFSFLLIVALIFMQLSTVTAYTDQEEPTSTPVIEARNSQGIIINQGYNKIKADENITVLISDHNFGSSLTNDKEKDNLKKDIVKNEAIQVSFGSKEITNDNSLEFKETEKISEDMITFQGSSISINFKHSFPANEKNSTNVILVKVKEKLDSKDYKFQKKFNVIVDDEAPTVKMFDVSSGKPIEISQYNAPYLFKSNESKFQLNLSDNNAISNYKVKLDGYDLNKTISSDGVIEILGSDIPNDGIHSITVSIEDLVGNTPDTTPIFNLRKDTTDTTFDVLGLKTLTNKPIDVTVNVTDYNLKRTEIFIDDTLVSTIYQNGSANINYKTQGHHKFRIVTIDYDDIKKEIYNVPFTIDMTDPVINFNSDSINSSGFTNMSYKPFCSLKEGYLMEGDTITSYEINGETVSPQSLKTLEAEGTYNVTAYASDPAGNTSSKSLTFTIDKTVPLVNINGILNNSYYNKTVSPTVDITDKHIRDKSVLLNGNNFVNGTEISAEGEHELFAKGVDMAENSAENTYIFTIDKTNPTISISGVINNSILNNFIKPLIDINENNSIISMLLNGEEYHGELITADGKYTLLVKSVDKAGNTTEQSLTFVLDTTKPKIKISGVEDGKYYKDSVKINVKTYEDADLTVTLNGNKYENDTEITEPGEYSLIAKATDKAGNTSEEIVEFTILANEEEAPPGEEISVSKPDADTDTDEDSFLSENKSPIIAGATIGALVIISVGIYIYIKKKKK